MDEGFLFYFPTGLYSFIFLATSFNYCFSILKALFSSAHLGHEEVILRMILSSLYDHAPKIGRKAVFDFSRTQSLIEN